MKAMKRLACALTAFTLLASLIHGRSFCVLAPYGLPETLYFNTAEGWRELRYDSLRRGPVLQAGTVPNLTVARRSVDEQGEPFYQPVWQSAFPGPAGAQCLLVLTSAREQGYRAQLFDDSVSSFPLSTIRFINLSGREIVVKIGEQNAVLAPFDSFEAERSGEEREKLVVRAATEVHGEPKIVYSQRRVVWPHVRYLLLATLDAETRQVGVTWLRDQP